MRIRTSFVSNSSSASFLIDKSHLTEDQITAIFNHVEHARKYKMKCGTIDYKDEWCIVDDEKFIGGETSMDNFDMYEFLCLIGVDMNDVDMDSENYVWEIEDHARNQAINTIKKTDPTKHVTLSFQQKNIHIGERTAHLYYHGMCPECNNEIRHYINPFDDTTIDQDFAEDELVRCRKCKNFFILLNNDGDADEWTWGMISYEDVKDAFHIIRRLGM